MLTLNSSAGTLAGGGIDQIAELEARCEEAAAR